MEEKGSHMDELDKLLDINYTKTDEELESIISVSPEIDEIKKKIKLLASTNLPVLIIGETGTGKESLARALHGDRKGNFVAVNTAGVPDNLLEGEFFGAVKGAYTGLSRDRIGYFEEAKNGTIFLDEIGDLPLLLQAKLLRTLQEGVIRRLGDNREIKINFRVVAATNRFDLVGAKSDFRRDLYYRLAGTVISVPPLSVRRAQDIKLIAESVLREMKCKTITLPDTVINDFIIKNRPWPGNVRQLINVVKEYVILNQLK